MISKGFLVLVPHSACKHSHEIPPWFSDCGMVKSNLGMVIKWEVEKKITYMQCQKRPEEGPWSQAALSHHVGSRNQI